MDREQLLFESSIKSKETLRVYQYSMRKFMEYIKITTFKKLANLPKNELKNSVEDFVMEKKSLGKSRSTIKMVIVALELFCDVNDIEIRWKKIRRLLPAQKKKSGGKAYSTEQVQLMLNHSIGVRNIALIHFLASTGVRIGAITSLRIGHVRDYQNGCKIVTVYAGDIEEYNTFLTPEASSALDRYLQKRQHDGETLDSEHPLFRDQYAIGKSPPKYLARGSFQAIISRTAYRSGIRYPDSGKRRDIQIDHGFRKRWNTILKTTDGVKIILAEKMFGHTTPTIPLDETYLDVSDESLFKEFTKAIPNLTVNSSERLRVKNQQLLQDKTELEKALEMKDDMATMLQKNETAQKPIPQNWRKEIQKMILGLNRNAS